MFSLNDMSGNDHNFSPTNEGTPLVNGSTSHIPPLLDNMPRFTDEEIYDVLAQTSQEQNWLNIGDLFGCESLDLGGQEVEFSSSHESSDKHSKVESSSETTNENSLPREEGIVNIIASSNPIAQSKVVPKRGRGRPRLNKKQEVVVKRKRGRPPGKVQKSNPKIVNMDIIAAESVQRIDIPKESKMNLRKRTKKCNVDPDSSEESIVKKRRKNRPAKMEKMRFLPSVAEKDDAYDSDFSQVSIKTTEHKIFMERLMNRRPYNSSPFIDFDFPQASEIKEPFENEKSDNIKNSVFKIPQIPRRNLPKQSENAETMEEIKSYFETGDYYSLVQLITFQKSDSEKSLIGMKLIHHLTQEASINELQLLLQCLKKVCAEEAEICFLRTSIDMILFFAKKREWHHAYYLLQNINLRQLSDFKPYLYEHPAYLKIVITQVYYYSQNLEATSSILKEEHFFLLDNDYKLTLSDIMILKSILNHIISNYFATGRIKDVRKLIRAVLDSQNSLDSPFPIADNVALLLNQLCEKNCHLSALDLFLDYEKLHREFVLNLSPMTYRNFVRAAHIYTDFKVVRGLILRTIKLGNVYPDFNSKTMILDPSLSFEEMHVYVVAWCHHRYIEFMHFTQLQLIIEIGCGDVEMAPLNCASRLWNIDVVKKTVSTMTDIDEETLFESPSSLEEKTYKLVIKRDFTFEVLSSAQKVWMGEKKMCLF